MTADKYHEKSIKKLCLLGATFTTNNMGVSVLTEGSIKTILASYPDAIISLLDYGKEELHFQVQHDHKDIRIKLINLRFSKKIFLENNVALLILLAFFIKLIPFKSVKSRIINFNPYLREISQMDLAMAISGGDSFSDIYGLSRLMYCSLPQILVLLLGKKLVQLPQTFGPFHRKISKMIARFILLRSSAVYSRDLEGLEEMKQLLQLRDNLSKLKFCYDVGFVVDPKKPRVMDVDGFSKSNDNHRPVIGLNVSGLLYMGGYTQDNMFGLKDDYRVLIHDLIQFLIQKKNAIVLLVPHVFGTLTNPESDSAVCEKIYGELKKIYNTNLLCVRGKYEYNEIKYIIGTCDFFIGSRMHACIAALSQNIPAVPIAYSKKFHGVMKTIGVEAFVADPRKLMNHEIIDLVDTAFEQKNAIKKSLEDKMPKVKEAVLNLFKDVII